MLEDTIVSSPVTSPKTRLSQLSFDVTQSNTTVNN